MHFNDIRRNILEENFKIVYFEKNLNIINYLKVEHFDSNIIIISYKDGSLEITGDKLSITRLVKDELIIKGNIKKIELR